MALLAEPNALTQLAYYEGRPWCLLRTKSNTMMQQSHPSCNKRGDRRAHLAEAEGNSVVDQLQPVGVVLAQPPPAVVGYFEQCAAANNLQMP